MRADSDPDARSSFFLCVRAGIFSVITLLLTPFPLAAEKPAQATESSGVRLTVELTDGSRIMGSPAESGLRWETEIGPTDIQWRLLHSAERDGEKPGFSLRFRNGDQARGEEKAKAVALKTVLGELNVPLAVTRRIRVHTQAGEGGPVAHWSFDNPAKLGADDSGHDHNLTVVDARPAEGRIGKGAETGGPDFGRHFKIESHPDLQFSGDFTVAAWVWRSAPIYDGDQIIAKEGEFSLRRYQQPTERYDVELFGKDGNPLSKVSETKSGLPLEKWTLIVVCRKGDRLSIRVNDLPAVESKVAKGEVGTDKPLFIGSSVVGYPWQGKLDEIKKWDYALSEEDQGALFKDAPPAEKPN